MAALDPKGVPASARRKWEVDATYARTLRTKYGLTPEQYLQMLEYQDGRCAVCRRLPGKARLNVEHDHKTRQVRGLTCFVCNKVLAHFRDSPETAGRLLDYLLHFPSLAAGVDVKVPEGIDAKLKAERTDAWQGIPITKEAA